MKRPFISKKSFKRRYNHCCICGEPNYDLLDVHRWRIEGKEGGRYSEDNCVCVCTRCHRLIHRKKITIINTFDSTKGKLVCFIDKEGQEKFNSI